MTIEETKKALHLSAAIALVMVGSGICALCLQAAETLRNASDALERVAEVAGQVPAEIHNTSGLLMGRMDSIVKVIQQQPRIETAAVERLDNRLASIQADTLPLLATVTTSAANTITGIREDVKPILAEAQETLNQASSTIADTRPQVIGLIAASKVTAGETAQTMREFQKAAPAFVQNLQRNDANLAGLTGDIHHMTSEIDRRFFGKKTLREKIWEGFKFGLTGAGTAARAGLL